MKTKQAIMVEFEAVQTQANRLEQCAEALRQVQSQMENIVQSLNSGWQGDSASCFVAKCTALDEKIGKSAANIQQISKVIQKTAKDYYSAELCALEIAQKRTYKA